jgi:hypothetical protein
MWSRARPASSFNGRALPFPPYRDTEVLLSDRLNYFQLHRVHDLCYAMLRAEADGFL